MIFFNLNTTRIALIINLGLSFLSMPSALAAAKPRPIIYDPVQWKEIHSWKKVGNRWEIGLDASGQTLAIYDYSYNDFENRLFLGMLDYSVQQINSILSYLKKFQRDPQVQLAIDHLNDLKVQHTKALSTTAKPALLPPRWWKTIPWKSQFRSMTDEAPKSFRLSEIDFQRVAKDPQEFQKQLDVVSPKILDHIQFISTSEETYSLYWNPPTNHGFDLNLGQPKKMIDLRCSQCSLLNSMAWTAAQQALNLAIKQIPQPILAGFLTTSIQEYLSLRSESTRLHEEMLFEMLQEAEEDPESLFSVLSPRDRQKAIDYLNLSHASFVEALQIVGTDSSSNWAQKKWDQQKTEYQSASHSSILELDRRSEVYQLLNPRFAFSSEGQTHKNVYILSRPKAYWSTIPHLAIQWDQPVQIQEERIRIETGRILTKFLTSFIPTFGVGTLISGVYEWALVDPMHLSQYWEARLAAHLESRLHKNEDWTHEIHALDHQKINPFIQSFEQAYELSQQRHDKVQGQVQSPLF